MDTETTMKEIATSHPAVARTLDKLQINYCCNSGGKLSLAEACQNANLNAIEALEKHRKASPLPLACFGSIENPLRQMHSEHDAVIELLTRMRQLTNGFIPPAEVCTSYRTAMQSLEALEADLLQHIQLENEVIFPLARDLAAKV